jgi:hypothetical protein
MILTNLCSKESSQLLVYLASVAPDLVKQPLPTMTPVCQAEIAFYKS